jgi:hypothetical protein
LAGYLQAIGGARMGLVLLVLACGSASEDTAVVEDADDGACGEVRTHDLEVRAAFEDASGAPIEGARVTLEERNWAPGTLGEGLTGTDGAVSFAAPGVTDVEGCWGSALDYWLVAEADGFITLEETMNSNLYNAIADGSLVADLRATPLVMERSE